MSNSDYVKTVVATIFGALVAIPSIVIGYYSIYQIVTTVGN